MDTKYIDPLRRSALRLPLPDPPVWRTEVQIGTTRWQINLPVRPDNLRVPTVDQPEVLDDR
jgi:hypothetical protein